jgi:hypothetical protein
MPPSHRKKHARHATFLADLRKGIDEFIDRIPPRAVDECKHYIELMDDSTWESTHIQLFHWVDGGAYLERDHVGGGEAKEGKEEKKQRVHEVRGESKRTEPHPHAEEEEQDEEEEEKEEKEEKHGRVRPHSSIRSSRKAVRHVIGFDGPITIGHFCVVHPDAHCRISDENNLLRFNVCQIHDVAVDGDDQRLRILW